MRYQSPKVDDGLSLAKLPSGISLAYETFGDRQNPAVLLVMGLGAQLIHWPEVYCRALADAGYFVIRFDNRDVGQSTRLDQLPVPNLNAVGMDFLRKRRPVAPYTIADMSEDALGLLDHLDIPAAHLIGASMGGMIAQTIAGEYPERCLSLTSIMSTTSHPSLPLPNWRLLLRLGRRPASSKREDVIQDSFKTWRLLGGPWAERSDDDLYQLCANSYDRSYYPPGVARQFVATLASGNRRRLLQQVKAPALVIHGRVDPLLKVECGIHTADNLTNARLVVLEKMGHDLPPSMLPGITQLTIHHLGAAKQPD